MNATQDSIVKSDRRGRLRYTKEQKSALVAAYQSSSLSSPRFAEIHGVKYQTVNGPKNRTLPGRPDLVLPKYRTVFFVHGCFWHGHGNCRIARTPGTRTEWWTVRAAA